MLHVNPVRALHGPSMSRMVSDILYLPAILVLLLLYCRLRKKLGVFNADVVYS